MKGMKKTVVLIVRKRKGLGQILFKPEVIEHWKCSNNRNSTCDLAQLKEVIHQSIAENKALQENERWLKQHIRSSGLHSRKEIPNDRNCLFHAVADQMESLG